MIKRITVIGAGSTGHAAAAIYSMKGFEVTLYDSRSHERELKTVEELGSIQLRGKVRGIGNVAHVTMDPADPVEDADLNAP